MKKAILYIHGKGGNAEEAAHYQKACDGYDVYGLDYKSAAPWQAKDEILSAYEQLEAEYASMLIIANSIGAFFALHALSGKAVERALFISPIVNMERLILDMMARAHVTERELREKQEIKTSFGETLSWKYLCYVRENPITWDIATDILYAGKDDLTSYDTISAFAEKTNASLTVMEDGEHWFHTDRQMAFLDNWLKRSLQACRFAGTSRR